MKRYQAAYLKQQLCDTSSPNTVSTQHETGKSMTEI